jgi:hypothetical protein
MRVHWPVTQHWTWGEPHGKHLLLSKCVFIGLLPSSGNGADHIENASSNTFSIVACSYFGRCKLGDSQKHPIFISTKAKNRKIVIEGYRPL